MLGKDEGRGACMPVHGDVEAVGDVVRVGPVRLPHRRLGQLLALLPMLVKVANVGARHGGGRQERRGDEKGAGPAPPELRLHYCMYGLYFTFIIGTNASVFLEELAGFFFCGEIGASSEKGRTQFFAWMGEEGNIRRETWYY